MASLRPVPRVTSTGAGFSFLRGEPSPLVRAPAIRAVPQTRPSIEQLPASDASVARNREPVAFDQTKRGQALAQAHSAGNDGVGDHAAFAVFEDPFSAIQRSSAGTEKSTRRPTFRNGICFVDTNCRSHAWERLVCSSAPSYPTQGPSRFWYSASLTISLTGYA